MKTRIQQIRERANDVRRSDDFGHSTQDLLHWESQQLTIVQNDIADLLAVVEVYEAGLKDVHDEIHDEHCEDDTHCNWCESLIMTLTKAQEIFSSSES